MRIVFDTWQFVRIMVRLEETRQADKARRELWNAWSDDWLKLDKQLENLRGSSFEAFSTVMMDQEVIFDPVDRSVVTTVAELAREVIGAIRQAERDAKGEALDDLQFERTGLNALARRLETLIKKGG